MKYRKQWLWIGIALFVLAAARYAFSDRRSLEVALKVDRLPLSVRNEAVRTDNWTDCSVDGYFEADAEDLRWLLTRRPYVEVPPHPEFGYLQHPPFHFFPRTKPFEPGHLFEWEVEEPFARCLI
jgi:hypothetical protein